MPKLESRMPTESLTFLSTVFNQRNTTTLLDMRIGYILAEFTELSLSCKPYREYLTGFHKRKVHRQNVAREIAKKKEYEEKLEARKEVSLTGYIVYSRKHGAKETWCKATYGWILLHPSTLLTIIVWMILLFIKARAARKELQEEKIKEYETIRRRKSVVLVENFSPPPKSP